MWGSAAHPRTGDRCIVGANLTLHQCVARRVERDGPHPYNGTGDEWLAYAATLNANLRAMGAALISHPLFGPCRAILSHHAAVADPYRAIMRVPTHPGERRKRAIHVVSNGVFCLSLPPRAAAQIPAPPTARDLWWLVHEGAHVLAIENDRGARECGGCRAQAPPGGQGLRHCKCGWIVYCSESCQAAHWASHRHFCHWAVGH